MKRMKHLELVHNWPDLGLQCFVCHFTASKIYLVPH
jgi:hypothetical protein